MADVLEKARAGRAKALQTRAANRLTGVSPTPPEGSIRIKPVRKASVPMFVSSRSRLASAENAIFKAPTTTHQPQKPQYISVRNMPSPSAHLH